MPVEVILPKVDMDMATGQIARWFVAEGAMVKKGDLLFEIETDKAAMEIDAPASGVLRNVTGKERLDIPVGQAVAWIYAEGEEAGTTATTEPSPRSLTGSAAEAGGPSPVEERGKGKDSAVEVPLATHSPADGRGQGQQYGSVRATPLARRLAREAGLDLASIAGSGPNGRIVRADVEAAAKAPPSGPPDGGMSRQTPPDSDPSLNLFPAGSYDLIPHDPMRRAIARRLTDAKRTIPHFYLTLDCALDALLDLRGELNGAAPVRDGQPAYRLSVNDLVVKAWAVALAHVPEANVSWTETHLVRHARVDVGMAVSIPGGLITPIVRDAANKTLSAIATETKDLAARAKARKLRPDEHRGGATSVSNLGMFGIRQFSAVINPPQATILGVGAGERRAVIRNDAIVAATMMSATLSADHRAVDGALAAELLRAFKLIVENPLQMLA